MKTPAETLSVTQAAELCGVGRTTVGYWIRSKKVRATRINKRNFVIHVDDLVHFLKKAGRSIPSEIKQDPLSGAHFSILYPCHEFHQGTPHGKNCAKCLVRDQELYPCFQTKDIETNRCPEKTCVECRYYQEMIQPRIQFVHQIEAPACVVQDLFFWGGNQPWAELCAVSASDLIGIGIESVIHSDCLAELVTLSRKMGMGDSTGLDLTLQLKVKDRRMNVRMSRLNEPEGGWLVVG